MNIEKKLHPLNFLVYRITNKINGKIYIGRTTGRLSARFNSHKSHSRIDNLRHKCTYLYNAMRKYGVENFFIELIEECSSFQEMKQKESYHIKNFNSCNPKIGYNLKYNTSDGVEFVSESTLKRMSNASHITAFNKANKNVGIKKYLRDSGKESWESQISYLNDRFTKFFSTKEEAIEWYDKLSLFFHGDDCPINDETKREQYLKSNLEEFYKKEKELREKTKNKPVGVSFAKNCNKYRCFFDSKNYGLYETKEAAIEMRDRIAVYFNKKEKVFYQEKIEKYKLLESETKKIIDFYSDKNRTRAHNKTGFHNIACNKNNWLFTVIRNGIRKSQYGFKSKECAAIARDIFIINSEGYEQSVKLNFPMASIFLSELSQDKSQLINSLKKINYGI